jgi:preprotein translocase subunit SecA
LKKDQDFTVDEKARSVIITEEDFAPVNPTTDDVVEGSRDIDS